MVATAPGACPAPTDDNDASDPAEVMASGCLGDHSDFEEPLSFELDFLSC